MGSSSLLLLIGAGACLADLNVDIVSDLKSLSADITDLERDEDPKQSKINSAGDDTCLYQAEPTAKEAACKANVDYDNGDGKLDDRGNSIAATIWEDQTTLKIYKAVIADCESATLENNYLLKIMDRIGKAGPCPVTKDPSDFGVPSQSQDNAAFKAAYTNPVKTRFAVDQYKYKNCDTTDGYEEEGDHNCGIGLGQEGFELIGSTQFRICEGGNVPNWMNVKDGQDALKKLVDDYKATYPSEAPAKKTMCRKLFDASSSSDYNIFKMLDNIVCSLDNPACVQVEGWYRNFMGSPMIAAGKKGRTGAETENGRSRRLSASQGHREACKDHYETGGNSDYAGVTEDLCDSCFPDPMLINEGPTSVFLKAHPAGKKQHLPGSNVALAYFDNCKAPFLGGISGTIAQFLRIAAGGIEGSAGDLTKKEMMTLIAFTHLGGHHTLTELIIAAKSYYGGERSCAAMKKDYFDEVEIPFDETGLNAKAAECVKMGDLTKYDAQGNVAQGTTEVVRDDTAYKAMMKAFDKLIGSTFA